MSPKTLPVPLPLLFAIVACSASPVPHEDTPTDAVEAGHGPADTAPDALTDPQAPGDAAPDKADSPPSPDAQDSLPDLAPDAEAEPDGPDAQCSCSPPSATVTVNGIPGPMNGSQPYLANSGETVEFRLALPTWDFAWEISVLCPCGCDDGIAASASVPAGDLPAGTDLFPSFEQGSKPGRWQWLVPQQYALSPSDDTLLEVTVIDACGQQSPTASLAVRTVEMTPALHPFDIEDPWLWTFSRDNYAIDWHMTPDGSVEVTATDGEDGNADFLQDLWLVGIGTPDPAAAFAALSCPLESGGNACLARELLERTRRRSYQAFVCLPDGGKIPGSVNLRLWLEGEPGAPQPADFKYQVLDGTESSRNFSMLGFGGGDLSKSWVGYSESVDVRNTGNENNGKKTLGVFTTSLVRYFFKIVDENPDLYALAQIVLADFVPALGGSAIGELDGDELVADFSIPDEDLPPALLQRRLKLETAMDLLAMGLAALAVHEMGHSLGLVPAGPPPHGLFAGEKKASFIVNPAGSVGPHIDTEGPNLMAAGPGSGNMDSLDPSYLTQPFAFNEINLAYLQGRLIVLPKGR